MTTQTLIEQLTWATVEMSNPTGKHDASKVAEILASALGLAILVKENEQRIQRTLIRTAQVMGE